MLNKVFGSYWLLPMETIPSNEKSWNVAVTTSSWGVDLLFLFVVSQLIIKFMNATTAGRKRKSSGADCRVATQFSAGPFNERPARVGRFINLDRTLFGVKRRQRRRRRRQNWVPVLCFLFYLATVIYRIDAVVWQCAAPFWLRVDSIGCRVANSFGLTCFVDLLRGLSEIRFVTEFSRE